MDPNPQFTIITSTLNSGLTLERCLRSVAAQTHPDFEHLIVDGASIDHTLALVEHYQSRYPLRLACSQPDSGLYQAWNRGVEQARGEWILFLGSDDMLYTCDVLKQVSSLLPLESDIAFLYGETADAGKLSAKWLNFDSKYWHNRLRGTTEFPNSVFIRRSVYDRGLRYNESYKICADHDFFARADFWRHSLYISSPLISFSMGGVSTSKKYSFLHYLERKRMLNGLGMPRPTWSEWYYCIRALLAQDLSILFSQSRK